MLQPKGMKPVKIVITGIKEGYEFSDRTDFFGAQMHDAHILEETLQGLKIINIVRVTGFLSWLWIKLVAQNVANTAESKIDALVNLTKAKNA